MICNKLNTGFNNLIVKGQMANQIPCLLVYYSETWELTKCGLTGAAVVLKQQRTMEVPHGICYLVWGLIIVFMWKYEPI